MKHLVLDMLRRYDSPDDPTGGSGNNASGSGSGGGNDSGNSDPAANGGTPNSGQNGDNGNTNNSNGNNNSNTGGNADADKKFTQADVNRFVQDRLDRETKKREKDDLEKQGQFEKLYNDEKASHETTKAELTGAAKYRDIVNQTIEDGIKDWPEEAKALDPGKDKLDARHEWFVKMGPLAARLKVGNTAPNGQHGSGGFGTGKQGTDPTQAYLDKNYAIPGQKKS